MNGASHSHLRFDMKRTVINHCALVLLLGGMMAAASAPAQPRGGDVYQAIIQRDFGTASNELIAVEKEIADTRPEQYAPIEARLIAVLEAPGATLPGKQFACQMLRTVGSAQCVPAVSRLLTDEKLSHVARQVFQDLRDPAVDEALRQALARTQGDLRLGIVHTLGDRRNRSSLEAISALAAGADEATARAALNALGKIGGAPRRRCARTPPDAGLSAGSLGGRFPALRSRPGRHGRRRTRSKNRTIPFRGGLPAGGSRRRLRRPGASPKGTGGAAHPQDVVSR